MQFTCTFYPIIQVTVEVLGVLRVEEEVSVAYSGDNVKLRLKGIEEEVCMCVCVCVCVCVCMCVYVCMHMN